MRRYILYKILLESTSPPLHVLAHIYLGFCMFVNKHHVILKKEKKKKKQYYVEQSYPKIEEGGGGGGVGGNKAFMVG